MNCLRHPVRTGTTYLTAVVPAGAHTGVVTVTTGTSALTSPQTYKVNPKLASFTPASGPVGTLVTITGTGLTQASAVKFGTVKAVTFTVKSDTLVTGRSADCRAESGGDFDYDARGIG